MGHVIVNLYRHPSGFAFDPDHAIDKLKCAFPEVEILPADQLAERIIRAENELDSTDPAIQKVIDEMRRDASVSGPAYGFTIPAGDANAIQGVVKRFSVQFGFDCVISNGVRAELIHFIRSLIPDTIEYTIIESAEEQTNG